MYHHDRLRTIAHSTYAACLLKTASSFYQIHHLVQDLQPCQELVDNVALVRLSLSGKPNLNVVFLNFAEKLIS